MNKTHYDEVVLIYDKKLNRYVSTRLDAYKRYMNTIKPLDDLISWWEK